jgi:hypothetical protein
MTNLSFREQGNERFKAGDFKEAEELYSAASVFSDDPSLAMTDCVTAFLNTLALIPKSSRTDLSHD